MPLKVVSMPGPFLLRWKQPVSTGVHHWYIRRLAADCRFWGYVHIRTEPLSENRSFEGTLPEIVGLQAFDLIRQAQAALHTSKSSPSEFCDGLLLEGNTSSAELVIACNKRDQEVAEPTSAFFELTELLQPFVADAAGLEE